MLFWITFLRAIDTPDHSENIESDSEGEGLRESDEE